MISIDILGNTCREAVEYSPSICSITMMPEFRVNAGPIGRPQGQRDKTGNDPQARGNPQADARALTDPVW
jgi:hypothetical protein